MDYTSLPEYRVHVAEHDFEFSSLISLQTPQIINTWTSKTPLAGAIGASFKTQYKKLSKCSAAQECWGHALWHQRHLF